MKKSRGTTLVEMLVVIFILVITMEVISAIFISGWKNFHEQSVQIEAQGQAKYIMSTVTSDIQKSSQVVENRYFGTNYYESSDDVIILKIPAIDANQNTIDNEYDYEVFFLDPADPHILKLTIETSPQSSRTSGTKIISRSIDEDYGFSCIYHVAIPPGSPGGLSYSVGIEIEVIAFASGYGITKTFPLSSLAKLRNKP